MIELIKDIEVLGITLEKGTKITWHGGTITTTKPNGVGGVISEMIIPSKMKSSREKFINEVCQKNTGHDTYELYQESLKEDAE